MRLPLAVAIAAFLLTGCGYGDGVEGGGTSQGKELKDAGAKDAGLADIAVPKDANIPSSCKGISADSRKKFSQFDDQCANLADCAQSGKCHCGEVCGADETKCSDAICATVNQTCLCGEKCEPTADKVRCPGHVCIAAGDITGCEEQKACKYVDKERDPKCKCTQMSGSEADCWCGDNCPTHYAACPSQLCKGKSPDKCVVVPGAAFKNCYCATCGLLGDTPKCFFVVCPSADAP